MFNRYPYTNFHELNLDYFIQHFNEIFTEWEQLYNELTSWKTDTTEELEQWRADVEADLDEREAALRAELEIWKQDTAEDISDWETATLNTLDAWKTAATAQFEAIRVQAAASAEAAAASQTAAETARTQAQAAQNAAETAAQSVQASAAQIQQNTDDISELKTQLADLFGIETTWLNGFWNATAKNFNTDTHYDHSDYIPISDVTIPIKYKIKVIYTVSSYILFDENKNYIDKYNVDSQSVVEVEDIVSDFKGASYIVFETYNANGYKAELNYCKVYDAKVQGFLSKNDKIAQTQLSFAEYVFPPNLFDYTDPDMCKPGYWYYSATVGTVMEPTTSQYTQNYVAMTVPTLGAEKVTIGMYPDPGTKKVYWVGAADADMKLLAYDTINQLSPVTYTLPAGTVYLLVSYNTSNFEINLPKIMVVAGEEITEYDSYEQAYYLLKDCRADGKTNDKTARNQIQKIQTIVGSDENIIKICAPDSYDLIVGDTFQLFYKGIINAVHPELLDIEISCTQGTVTDRYFEITPASSGNIPLTITIYGINHNMLDRKTVTLKTKAKPSSPATQKNILCVGDSLTTTGTWPVEFHRRLTGQNGSPEGDSLTNINFIGTRVVNNVHFEGQGGRTFESYNTANVSTNVRIITTSHDKTEAEDQHSIYKDANDVQWKLETISQGQITIIAVTGEGTNFPNSGTLTWVSGGVNHSNIVYSAQEMGPGNPFWNTSENKVDFASYAQNQGVSSIDYVYVLLGWNSWPWNESRLKESAQTFIDNVHADFPNAIIVLIGLEIPSREGLGNNYGGANYLSHYYFSMNYVFNVDNIYRDLADENSNVYSVNLSGQFDTEYNMPSSTRQVNSRNSEMVTYQSNGVHPGIPGYYQIADAAYRDIASKLS